MGKAQRNKGATGERELANILQDRLGTIVKRNIGQARDGGDDITVKPFRIEVKRHERLSVMDWCRQVEAACDDGDIPVVAFRQNGEQWRVVLKLEDFITLMQGELIGDLLR